MGSDLRAKDALPVVGSESYSESTASRRYVLVGLSTGSQVKSHCSKTGLQDSYTLTPRRLSMPPPSPSDTGPLRRAQPNRDFPPQRGSIGFAEN